MSAQDCRLTHLLAAKRAAIAIPAIVLAPLAVSFVGLSVAFPAQAQSEAQADTESPGLEEIVVTARKKPENLFQTPVSITSLTAQDIENADIRNIDDLTQVTPGFFYTAQTTFSDSRVAPSYRFRGVNNGSNDPLNQLGGTFLDGVYLLGGVQSLTFSDIERVEVVKGPQSAEFGRGTFAGAINFITKEPADHFQITGDGSVESYVSHTESLSVEGPVTDWLSFRFSGEDLVKAAQFHAADGGGLGKEGTDALNAQIVLTPIDGLRIRVRTNQTWEDDSRNAVVNLNANLPIIGANPSKCMTGTQLFWCGAIPNLGDPGVPDSVASVATQLISPAFAASNNPSLVPDILNNNTANPLVKPLPLINDVPHLGHSGLAGQFQRNSVEANYVLDNGVVVNGVLTQSDMRTMTAEVTTNNQGDSWVISPNIMKDSSVDFTVASDHSGPFTWLVGGNYFEQISLGGSAGTGAIASVSDVTEKVSYSPPATFTGQGKLRYLSAFFALHYDILDQLGIDFEGRYQIDRKTTSYQLSTQTTGTYRDFLPRVTLTYKADKDTIIYATYASSVAPGTSNSAIVLYSPAIQAYFKAISNFAIVVPEQTISNYEIGVKQTLGQYRYALTGYYMDWDNLQNLVSEPCPGNVCGPTVFGPFANFTLPQSAKIYGGEAEVDALVTDKLDASLSLAYAHATFDQYSVPTALAATGQTTANGKTIFGFPPLQATFNATYKDALASTDWDWYVRPEVNYTGRIYVDEVNQSWIPGTFRLNLRAGLEEGSLRFEGYIDNLTDNRTWLAGQRGSSSNYTLGAASVSQASAFMVLPRLRTFGVRLKYVFG